MSFEKLINWSQNQYHYLPWRKERSLFGTLVSEIMLQQTTVGTVLNHYPKFMKQFSSIQKLARLSEEELTIAWKGLGYYRRARNLKKACEEISKKYKNEIPLDPILLKEIPGIGDYTAHALLSIGADQSYLALDANLERVIARLFAIKEVKGPKLLKMIYAEFKAGKILKKELKKFGGRAVNEALMDLGRVICKSKNPQCAVCPLKLECKSYELNLVNKIPNVSVKKKENEELHLLRLVVKKDNKILVYQKEKGEWLEGQWELPTFIIRSTDENLVQYLKLNIKFETKNLKQLKTTITKYKILNFIKELDEKSWIKAHSKEFKKRKCEWVDLNSISKRNVSTSLLKIIAKI